MQLQFFVTFFNFANFSEAGLKRFAAVLEQKDGDVVSITATNKVKKLDGKPTKRATLFFSDQQKAEIVIGGNGDIVTLKINGKPTPTGSPKTLIDFARPISKVLKSGFAAFDKSLKRRLARIKVDTPQKKPASRTNKARIDEAETLLKQATADLQKLRVSSTEQLEALSANVKKETELNVALDAEKKRNKTLKSTLAALTK